MVNFARLKLVAAVGAIACAQLAFLCLLQLPPAGSYLAGGSLLPAQGVQLAGVVLPQHVVAAALWGVLAALAAKLSAAFDAMRQAFVYKVSSVFEWGPGSCAAGRWQQCLVSCPMALTRYSSQVHAH